ncbi:MAG: histidinol-phosphatase HisJ family protein [marine benthic group bacterium]|jgi:histidinol-phosphatase (PHP family)|nr:histidinol-phosphatase HisJ family protein [Gemmatimonadota bacterium]MCL7966065.1 histidinol-phosphatase HisJ family protein [Gemmatimonadota bacterium]MCL7968322.1 histidinol-phosphatase HisJ family protein [Gemmatimonadota bacterium]MCL7973274.1 histidinol-phosphatase HisJ family protein [Gemmatimonadota bacterium]MCL7977039.1 histidinol-phosphatase HisJ family protein [Gemmatimonadota bacterium]
MINYHFHDEHSSDGARPLVEHCEAARRAGILEICVTNHVEALREDGSWVVDFEEAVRRFERVLESVVRARSRFPELTIRFGAEFAYRPEWTDPLDRLAESLPFDFILGSLHDVDGIDVSGPNASEFFRDRPLEAAYGRYFEALHELVEWGTFDAVAHFDLVKRYGHRAYGEFAPSSLEAPIRSVLAGMGRAGIGIEVNTSGCAQWPRAPYPDESILTWAREEGVPFLTLGSDSHAPEHFTQGITDGSAHASRAGWDRLTIFEARRPIGTIPLQPNETQPGGDR